MVHEFINILRVKILGSKNILFKALLLLLLTALYIVLYKLYIPKVNAFGCFDDCFNFMGGYFISKGKTLYSEIFFDHQPLMAYISYLIQSITHPESIYELVLRHRQIVFLFGFLFNALLIFRFGIAGFGFILFYEFGKYYLFGDRFLAEGLIVYPIVYIAGLVWQKYAGRKIFKFEYLMTALFAWFVIFMREPYVPLAILLYGLILLGSINKAKIISLLLFLILTIFLFTLFPFKDYFFNVVTVNQQTILAGANAGKNLLGTGSLQSFFYPVYLLYGGEWSHFRYVAVGLVIVYFASIFQFLHITKKYKLILVMFLVMGLSNLRSVTPAGKVFYEAFHMLSWYAVFLMTTFLLVKEIYYYKRIAAYFLGGFLLFLFGFLVTHPSSYVREENSQFLTHESYLTNYGRYLQAGEVIRTLSNEQDTLFVDGYDELIYFQAKRVSPYKYTWYTSVMPLVPQYSRARAEMFLKSPPDFYYGSCPNDKNATRQMPQKARADYIQLHSFGKPTCIYVRKDKIKEIPEDRWKKAKEWLYELPRSSE